MSDLKWLATFGASIEFENQDFEEVSRRAKVAEREIKNVLAAHGLRAKCLSSVHGPQPLDSTWGPGA